MRRLIVIACLIALANCNCGCLKCNPHLKLVSKDDSPIEVIIRGDKNVPHPPQQHTCPMMRQYYQSLGYPSLGNALPEGHNIEVQVPIDLTPYQPNYQGLVASPDRVILPEKQCVKRKPVAVLPECKSNNHEVIEDLRNSRMLRYDYYIVPKENTLYTDNNGNKLLQRIRNLKPDVTIRVPKGIRDNGWNKNEKSLQNIPLCSCRNSNPNSANVIKKQPMYYYNPVRKAPISQLPPCSQSPIFNNGFMRSSPVVQEEEPESALRNGNSNCCCQKKLTNRESDYSWLNNLNANDPKKRIFNSIDMILQYMTKWVEIKGDPPTQKQSQMTFMIKESEINEKYKMSFLWNDYLHEEPLKDMQSLIPLEKKPIQHQSPPKLEFNENLFWKSKESEEIDALNTNIVVSESCESSPNFNVEISEVVSEIENDLSDSNEKEDSVEDLFDLDSSNGRYPRDTLRIQNRMKTLLLPHYEKTEFPWQLEYQKLLKKPGYQHPMVRPKPSTNTTNAVPKLTPLTNNGSLILNDFQFKMNELRKRIESNQKSTNQTQTTLSKVLGVKVNVTGSNTSNTVDIKEKVAKMRENLKQKLESRKNYTYPEGTELVTTDSQKTNERKKRETYFDTDIPFFKITDAKSLTKNTVDSEESEEIEYILQQKKEARLEQSLMKPFNAEHIVPHDPIFYLLNFPIRCLDHLNSLKDQLSPILHAFPLMLQKSRKYFKDMSKDAKKDVLDFGSNVVGSFTRLSPSKNPWDVVTPSKRRNKREIDKEDRNLSVTFVGRVDPTAYSSTSELYDMMLNKTREDDPQIGSVNSKERREDVKALEQLLGKVLWAAGRDKTQQKVVEKDKNIDTNTVMESKSGPSYEPLYQLAYESYDPYEEDSETDNVSNNENEHQTILKSDVVLKEPLVQHSRRKRAIFKLVDEDEIGEYLKEKFSSLEDVPEFSDEYHLQRPEPTVLRSTKYANKETDSSKNKIVLERIVPKIIIDDNGRPFAEIDGMKRPLFNTLKKPLKSSSKSPIVGSNHQNAHTKDGSLSSVIAKAKRYTKDGENFLPGYSHDTNVHTKTIKNRLSQILDYIETLLHWDFEDDVHIYEDLLELQNRKEAVIRNWKMLLVQNRHNIVNEKIVLLKTLKKIQELKDSSMAHIVDKLHEGHSFNTRTFIKFLIMLQKLHCLIVKVAEEFSDSLHIGKFDVDKEIEFVDYLQNIEFFDCENQEEIREVLEKERDSELEREIAMLEDLKQCLALAQNDKKYDHLIFEEAKLLWEFKNIEKLQQESLAEMNKKLKAGLKIRKELKILFDLQKQYDSCEEKHAILIDEILRDGGKKSKTIRLQDEKLEELNLLGSKKQKMNKIKKHQTTLKPKHNSLSLLSNNNRSPHRKTFPSEFIFDNYRYIREKN
ncbi:uncharacterized protein LOC108744239 [Agrilus planipennis]|uniref:Uncharacterized protein LOC108744239 n=1 Tax=Agrilus planipennis TaxID=224129 RepID=A0A1W4XSK9_AGRPL|nr:uncharacterized protein LOC108744239 [Agrilus planipennis]